GFNRLAFPAQFNRRHDTDCLLDGNLFLRVMRGKFGLPNSERNFSPRDSGIGDCILLRSGDGCRRSRCTVSVRSPNRYGLPYKRVLMLPVWVGSDDYWRLSCLALDRGRREQTIGRARPSTTFCRRGIEAPERFKPSF